MDRLGMFLDRNGYTNAAPVIDDLLFNPGQSSMLGEQRILSGFKANSANLSVNNGLAAQKSALSANRQLSNNLARVVSSNSVNQQLLQNQRGGNRTTSFQSVERFNNLNPQTSLF